MDAFCFVINDSDLTTATAHQSYPTMTSQRQCTGPPIDEEEDDGDDGDNDDLANGTKSN